MSLDRPVNALDMGTLTVSTTAVGLSSASPVLPDACNRAFITAENDAVRWRADGTDPTSSIGHVLAKNDSISFTSINYHGFLKKIRFIRVTTDATLRITYFD